MAHIEDWIGRLSRSRMKDDQCAGECAAQMLTSMAELILPC